MQNNSIKLLNFDHLPYRAAALLVPLGVLALHLILMYVALGYVLASIVLGLMVAYILPPAGKETVIPLGIALGIPWWWMAFAIAMVDIETGLFMALNLDLLYRIPRIGNLLARFTDKTAKFLESHSRIAKLSFLGIILMVMVPVLGSGGVRGSIAGNLLGIEARMVFLAVAVGAIFGCLLIALGSDVILRYICDNGLIPPALLSTVCNF